MVVLARRLCAEASALALGGGLVIPTLLTWPHSAVVHDIRTDRRLALDLLALPAVRPHRSALGPLQPAAGSAQGAARGARRAERRRHLGRSRRHAGAAEPLGEDRPRPAGRRHPARAVCRGRQDAGRRRHLPVRPRPHLRAHATGDDDHQSPRHGGRPARSPRRRLGGARGTQQVRERAFRRAVHRHELPRPLPRPGGSRRHRPVGLAHRRSGRGRSTSSICCRCRRCGQGRRATPISAGRR